MYGKNEIIRKWKRKRRGLIFVEGDPLEREIFRAGGKGGVRNGARLVP